MAGGLNLRDALSGIARFVPAVRAGRLSPGAALAMPYASMLADPARDAPAPAAATAAAQYYVDELAAIARADLSGLDPRSAVATLRAMARASLDRAPEAVRAHSGPEVDSLRGTMHRLSNRLIPNHGFGQAEAAEILASAGGRLVASGAASEPTRPGVSASEVAPALKAEAERLEGLAGRIGSAARAGEDLSPLLREASEGAPGNAERAMRRAVVEVALRSAFQDLDADAHDALLRDRAVAETVRSRLDLLVEAHARPGGISGDEVARRMDSCLEGCSLLRGGAPVDTYVPGR